MISHLKIDEVSGEKFIYLILDKLTFNMSVDECKHFQYFESNDSIMYHALCFTISKDDAKAIFEKIAELNAFYAK